MSTQSRVPAGVTTGGQFSTSARGESPASLTAPGAREERYTSAATARQGDWLLGRDGEVLAVVREVVPHASKPGFVTWRYEDGTSSAPMRGANETIRISRATAPDPALVAKQEAIDAAAERAGLTGSRLVATPEGADLEHDGTRYTLSTDSNGNDLFVYAQDEHGKATGPSIDARVLASVGRAEGYGVPTASRHGGEPDHDSEMDAYFGARTTLRRVARDAGMAISDLP
ncbi:hypothetical protein [Cellulosimicrobium sp. Marseille-Q4280]|uniref:hypothetical protein n=1 Tax=Cellulosimicrobium sp. Marseille-Q4280 TaxID=2937992 RepID=UPI002040C954|nr:hypothetical protein [Cellulosimicrobium sp. Marseille-Q4280]